MTEQVNAVEPTVEKAPEVTKVEASQPTQTEVDLAVALAEKDKELADLAKERDNYKRGLLKAKGKPISEEIDDADEDLNSKVARLVSEQLLTTKEAQIQADKDAIIKKALKENSELKVALKNSKGMTPSGGSSSADEPIQDEISKIFSKEQLEDLKKRGLDPKIVAKNLNRPMNEVIN